MNYCTTHKLYLNQEQLVIHENVFKCEVERDRPVDYTRLYNRSRKPKLSWWQSMLRLVGVSYDL